MSFSSNYKVPVSFYFRVHVDSIGDLSFKEVTGLTSELELESIQEGGNNEFELKFPKKIKYHNLVLKRALAPITLNLMMKWVIGSLENDFSTPFERKDIMIYLLNEQGKPLRGWYCYGALPIKYEADSFESEKNKIAIETIELTYLKLIRTM